MGLFGRGFIAREIAIQDMQAVAEATGKSHKQRRGTLQSKRRMLGRVVLNQSPLEEIENSGL